MKRSVVLAAAAFLALAGCGADTDNASTAATGDSESATTKEPPFDLEAAPVETTEVEAVKSYKFDPEVIEVAAGTDVTWTNQDDFPHNVHFLMGADETHDLPIGHSINVTFDEGGEFYYECSLHPQQMRGKVIVTE